MKREQAQAGSALFNGDFWVQGCEQMLHACKCYSWRTNSWLISNFYWMVTTSTLLSIIYIRQQLPTSVWPRVPFGFVLFQENNKAFRKFKLSWLFHSADSAFPVGMSTIILLRTMHSCPVWFYCVCFLHSPDNRRTAQTRQTNVLKISKRAVPVNMETWRVRIFLSPPTCAKPVPAGVYLKYWNGTGNIRHGIFRKESAWVRTTTSAETSRLTHALEISCVTLSPGSHHVQRHLLILLADTNSSSYRALPNGMRQVWVKLGARRDATTEE